MPDSVVQTSQSVAHVQCCDTTPGVPRAELHPRLLGSGTCRVILRLARLVTSVQEKSPAEITEQEVRVS